MSLPRVNRSPFPANSSFKAATNFSLILSLCGDSGSLVRCQMLQHMNVCLLTHTPPPPASSWDNTLVESKPASNRHFARKVEGGFKQLRIKQLKPAWLVRTEAQRPKDRWNKAVCAWPRLLKTKSTWRAGRVDMQQIGFYLNLARLMLSPTRFLRVALALPAINEPPVKVPLKAQHCPTATKDVPERLFHRSRRTASERRFATLTGWWVKVCLAQRDFREDCSSGNRDNAETFSVWTLKPPI